MGRVRTVAALRFADDIDDRRCAGLRPLQLYVSHRDVDLHCATVGAAGDDADELIVGERFVGCLGDVDRGSRPGSPMWLTMLSSGVGPCETSPVNAEMTQFEACHSRC
jgi:hypothetical protein